MTSVANAIVCAVVLCVASAASRAGHTDYADYADLPCPATTAHVTVHDYAGPFELDFCVDPNGLGITGGVVTLVGGDPFADGLFHNGFETAQ